MEQLRQALIRWLRYRWRFWPIYLAFLWFSLPFAFPLTIVGFAAWIVYRLVLRMRLARRARNDEQSS